MWSHGQPADQAVALIDLVDVGSETSSRCGFGNQENFKVFEELWPGVDKTGERRNVDGCIKNIKPLERWYMSLKGHCSANLSIASRNKIGKIIAMSCPRI